VAVNSRKYKRNETENNVLFQKLGNRWYVFTEQDGEIIYSAMPEGVDPRNTKLELYNVIEDHLDKVRTNIRKLNV